LEEEALQRNPPAEKEAVAVGAARADGRFRRGVAARRGAAGVGGESTRQGEEEGDKWTTTTRGKNISG
jgi:hypothetical protein